VNLLDTVIPFGPLLGKVFDRVFPNPEDKAKAQLEVLKMNQAGEFRMQDSLDNSDAGQVKVNMIEAGSDSLFKSGWRPAAGWACVSGLWYQFLLSPLLWWLAQNFLGWTKAPPELAIESLMTLLFGLLGLGAYRTYERVNKK
jgi:Holin of 3TMs, for gene-transfer release